MCPAQVKGIVWSGILISAKDMKDQIPCECSGPLNAQGSQDRHGASLPGKDLGWGILPGVVRTLQRLVQGMSNVHRMEHPFCRLCLELGLCCPVVPFFPFFWEGFPFKLKQRKVPFFPMATGHLRGREVVRIQMLGVARC